MDNATTVQYAALLHQLAGKTKTTVRDLDPNNELTFLRIRTQKHEIMVAPGELGREGGTTSAAAINILHVVLEQDHPVGMWLDHQTQFHRPQRVKVLSLLLFP